MRNVVVVAFVLCVLAGCAPKEATERFVNVYTSRHYAQDDALYEQFTKQTGIRVNVVKGEGPELLERLVREKNSPSADAYMTADAGMLYRAKSAGVLTPMKSDEIQKNVPERWRDPAGYWIAVTKRARVIVYNKARVSKQEAPQTYEALADPLWRKRVLIRSSSNVYNQSLTASFLALWGVEKTKKWAEGIVANMARAPKGGDRDQAKAVIAGEGDVAVMNTYYLGQMANSTDAQERLVAEQLGIVWPNQATTGTHVNVSGIGIVQGARHANEALQLIAFLTSAEAQKQFAATNYEYPIHPDVQPSQLLQSWGTFREQQVGVDVLGEKNGDATKRMIEAGWK
jgi:iron(III) transport system substrate-binding protein